MQRNIKTAVVVSTTDLSKKRLFAVDVAGALTAATGATIFGIVNRPASAAGEGSEVIVSGETDCIAGGSFDAGDPLTGAADGKIVKATIGTHLVRGIAMKSAAADGATANIYLF